MHRDAHVLKGLKEPGPIASDFVQTFGDFGIGNKLNFFSLSLVNFTAEMEDINENVTTGRLRKLGLWFVHSWLFSIRYFCHR